MGRSPFRCLAVAAVGGGLAVAGSTLALGSYHQVGEAHDDGETTEVAAAGNPFTGGLAFDPEHVAVAVGDTVRWTNTDFLVPHTATEDNGLWDLAGDYGGTPVNPPGFGPGESRERRFEAGSWSYFCRVHGAEAQSGTVTVPVKLRARSLRSARRGGGRRFTVIARWSRTAAAKGQAFDVQRRVRGGWSRVEWGTERTATRFRRVRAGRRFVIRARVRRLEDGAAAGWSPAARLRTGH